MKSDEDAVLAMGVPGEVQANEKKGNVEECIIIVGGVQAKSERVVVSVVVNEVPTVTSLVGGIDAVQGLVEYHVGGGAPAGHHRVRYKACSRSTGGREPAGHQRTARKAADRRRTMAQLRLVRAMAPHEAAGAVPVLRMPGAMHEGMDTSPLVP